MGGTSKQFTKRLRWQLECLGHWLVEILVGALPSAWAFWLGDRLGGLVWHWMPQRRKVVLRNLRIAFAGEKDLDELRGMARATFRRAGANLICAAHSARLSPEKLKEIIVVDHPELLEEALAGGRGVVVLLAHMGNWELLTRMVHLLPAGTQTGAFYRPLSNELLDKRILKRREADGTRMFSKRDSPHQVAGFLRAGGMVGVLADQRVGPHGEVVEYFGRVTRASPLPGLLARRTKSTLLALALATERPGQWRATFLPVEAPTVNACAQALESLIRRSPVDVFWLQERWKPYINSSQTITEWLGAATGRKPHRALLWLNPLDPAWTLPAGWIHPDVIYEVAIAQGAEVPGWLPEATQIHRVATTTERAMLQHSLAAIDAANRLPIDYVLSAGPHPALHKAGRREAIPVISLP